MKKINESAGIRWTLCALCIVGTATAVIQIPKLSAAESNTTAMPASVSPIASSPAMMDVPAAPATPATPATTNPAKDAIKTDAVKKPTAATDPSVLPEQFKVYYNPKLGISKKVYKGATEKVILTNNENVKDGQGCYVSCFSKNAKDAVYPVDTNVYLMGQIRVQGQYHNGNCLPKGFEDKDVRASKEFKAKCEEAFPERCEKDSCWASGSNTANWF